MVKKSVYSATRTLLKDTSFAKEFIDVFHWSNPETY